MNLTALQLPARFEAQEAQLSLTEWLLRDAPSPDVVLLPEASLTGYVSPQGDFSLSAFAEPLDGPTVSALARLAKRFDCLMVGPLIEWDSQTQACFNSLVGLGPDGTVVLHYRKCHPWFPETWAQAGQRFGPSVRWRGMQFMAAICFDIHFLEAEAADCLAESDVLLFSSAWVDDGDTLPSLLSEVARRHQLSVLNANWGPGEPAIPGQGRSLFVNTAGQVQSRLTADTGRLDITL
jgi:predicted amidohydrolase